MPAEILKKNCFVIMGFGKKTDFATGRTLDLDATYRSVIKPAVQDAGLECLRADEIVHAGLTDLPMYEQLLKADVVIADLSTANPNVLYELGVRHALRPYTTIIIAEDQFYAVPFDVTTVRVIRYTHMGNDLGYFEVMRFRKELTATIVDATSKNTPSSTDSPLYMLMPGLNPPAMAKYEVTARAGDSASILIQQADEAQRKGDFLTAKNILMHARDAMKPEDPYIVQRLALVTYKSRQPTPIQALEEARALLETLNPATSNDTETLGLWGAVHKRLWEETQDVKHLDEAVRGYERGFHLQNDYYNGINLAYLLNVRAANAQSRPDAIADFVQAQRVRREVLSICESVLKNETLPDAERYWAMATEAEAYLGIGDEAGAQQKLAEASVFASASWMKDSTQEQLGKLGSLLRDSPLKSL